MYKEFVKKPNKVNQEWGSIPQVILLFFWSLILLLFRHQKSQDIVTDIGCFVIIS